MFTIRRCHSVQIKREKVYRQQPPQRTYPIHNDEQEKPTSLFPHRNFSKKLSLSHHRIQSHIAHKNNSQKPQNAKNSLVILNQPQLQPPPLLANNISSNTYKSVQSTISQPTFIRSSASPLKPSSQNAQQLQSQSLNKQSNRRQFLRKGSNLQKQIIINLLRNKILRENEEQIQKEYDNDQILKMIHVFKGVALSATGQRKKLFSLKDIKKGDQHARDLVGWQSRKEEMLYTTEQKF